MCHKITIRSLCIVVEYTQYTHTHIYKTENIWINVLIPLKSGKPIKLVQRFCAHHVQNMGTECKSVGGIFLKDDHHFETVIWESGFMLKLCHITIHCQWKNRIISQSSPPLLHWSGSSSSLKSPKPAENYSGYSFCLFDWLLCFIFPFWWWDGERRYILNLFYISESIHNEIRHPCKPTQETSSVWLLISVGASH